MSQGCIICVVGAATGVVVRILVRLPAGTNTVRRGLPYVCLGMLGVLLASVSWDLILVVLSIEVGATGALVTSATVGGTDGVLVVVSLGVILNELIRSGIASGRSCITVVL